MAEPDWAKLSLRPLDEREQLDKADARAKMVRVACINAVPKRGFARITEDMIPLMGSLGGPAVVLWMVCIMYSGRRRTIRAEGWMKLPGVVWQQVGLGDRAQRARATKRLIARDLVETRQATPGSALEYRLRPFALWKVAPPPTRHAEPEQSRWA
jgi:hypothetical protein